MILRFPVLFGEKAVLIGDFNDWDFKGITMTKRKDNWVSDIDIKKGVYQYKFLIDDKLWINDPEADMYINNSSFQRKTINSMLQLSNNRIKIDKDYGEITDVSFSNFFSKELLMNRGKNKDNQFNIRDGQIYIYNNIKGCVGEVEISYVWCTPDFKIYDCDSTLLKGYGGEQRLYHYINLNKKEVKPGLWKVFVLVNGTLMAEEKFILKSNFYYHKSGKILIK